MNNTYNYIFHCSEYREPEQAWACIHRDDAIYYWNGTSPLKGLPIRTDESLKIAYGSTPKEAAERLGLSFE